MQVIGHRGAAGLAPENTWAGFDLALDLGVDAIETDIRATCDGELVLLHDSRLERTTNGQGFVQDSLWSVVRNLDAGSWFGEQYQNARVPRLNETLNRYGERTHLVLEIKQPGLETEVLQQVQALNLLHRVTFTAFDFAALQTIKAQAPSAAVGWLVTKVQDATIAEATAARFDQICLPVSALSPARVAELRAVGLAVRAWKVTDEAAMRAALRAEVYGMTIDFPHLLLNALGRTPSSDRLR